MTEAFKGFLVESESNFRTELAAGAISPAETEAALEGFRKSLNLQLPILLAIRDADQRMGQAMLAVLNLWPMGVPAVTLNCRPALAHDL